MTLIESLTAALLLAFAGAGHCVGMCGAISMTLSFSVPEAQRQGGRLALWQGLFAAGRLVSYTLLGAAAGAGGEQLMAALPGGQNLPWLLAAAVMILIALFLLGRELGVRLLEQAGLAIWRRVQPLMKPMLPVRRAWQALLVGMLWGLMPCGLLYSALALALASGGGPQGALVMLVFGLVTVIPVAGTGLLGGRFQAARKPAFRRAGAVLALLFAGWLLWHAWPGAAHQHPAAPVPAASSGQMPHSHHH